MADSDRNEESDDENGLSRRQYLAVAGVGSGAVLGGLWWTGFFLSAEDHANHLVESLEENVEGATATVAGDLVQLTYQTTGSISHDLELVGLAYADVVADGLSLDLEATAAGASNSWTFSIPNSLAKDYNSGGIDEDEYLDQIE